MEAPDDSLNGGKPEAAARLYGGVEGIEDPGLCFGCHAAAGLGDLELEVVARRQSFRGGAGNSRLTDTCRGD